MAFEIPTARIRQLQEDLRREAGLPSYDPADSPLPQLPSIADAVGALDPDLPASLCCGRCGGGLLRGLQSTLCIYCGLDRSTEGSPYSISFHSTVGCRKLLDFLGLDGSEAVFLDSESSGSNKSQETQKSGLVLSDLLDLELRWPSDEVVDNNTTATTPSPHIYGLSSTGVDLDNFFSERNRVRLAIASECKEEVIPRKNTDKKVHASYGSENFAAFEKLQTAETKSSSLGSTFGESFAVWNAEFQPASTSNTSVSPKSPDLFQDSSVRGCTPATTAVATTYQVENIDMLGEIGSKSEHPTTVNKQSEDDFWPIESANVDASTPQKPETPDDTTSILDGMSSRGTRDFNVQEDLRSTSSTKESENSSHINPHEDPFDPWQDFTTSIEKRSSSNQGPKTGSSLFEHSFETKSAILIPEGNKNELGENKPVDAKNGTVEDWQDFSSFEQRGSSSSHGTQSGVTFSDHSLEIKSVDPLHTSSNNGSDSLATIDNIHDSSDVWQDFAGSRETSEDSFNQEGQTGVTSSKDSLRTNSANPWPTSNVNDLDKDKSLHGDDDSSDDWQDFTSFSNGPERSANLGIPSDPTLLEQHSEMKPVDSWPTKGEIESGNGCNNVHDSSDVWQDFAGSRETPEDLFNQESQTGVTSSRDSLRTNSADPWPTSNINNLEKDKSLHGDDDSSDDWQDFTSFSNGPEISANLEIPSGPTMLEMKPVESWPTKGETESANGHDNVHDSSDVWQDFPGSRKTLEDSFNREGQTGVSSSKDSLGTKSVDPWPTSNIIDIKEKSLHVDDDSFDDWQDFTSFSKGPEKSANVGTPSAPTLFEQPSETKSVYSWPTKRKTESTNGHDDVFDDWQDFTSSTPVQQSSLGPGEQSMIPFSGHPSETNAVYQQGKKTYDFSQTWEEQKDYPDETDLQFSSFSKKEADRRTTGDPNPLLWDTMETTKSSNANSNSRPEKSRSEKSASLPDLSFMLVDELSIPEKPSETSF